MFYFLFGVFIVVGISLGFVIWLWIKAHEKKREEFRQRLLLAIEQRSLEQFKLSKFAQDLSVKVPFARRIATSVYKELFRTSLKDGRVSEKERTKLRTLVIALEIESKDWRIIESREKKRRYRETCYKIVESQQISADRAQRLFEMKENFNLTDHEVWDAVKDLHPHYVTFFERIARNAKFTKKNRDALRLLRQILAIGREEAQELVRETALEIYREYFYEAKQDGHFSEQEIEELSKYERYLGLTPGDIEPYHRQIKHVQFLEKCRQGELPRQKTGKILEGGEICHWDSPCTFIWQKKRRRQGIEYIDKEDVSGELTVTSNRIIFTSPTKNFVFRPSRIIDIERYSDGISLQTSGAKGTGRYLVRSPETFEAIVYGLVRRHKYQLAENFSSSYSRHIPDAVKREVWAHDGGRCVKCNSSEYLEFDHIIPHSKGGANTVQNVQLLCRKCNLMKSDRI